MKNRIEKLKIFFNVLFIILSVYIFLLQILWRSNFVIKKENPRNTENFAYRGLIYDRKGEALCINQAQDKGTRRNYPQKELFSPLIGYAHNRMGKEGVEKYLDTTLKGKRLPETLYEAFSFVYGKNLEGQDVYLTLDSRIQKAAADAMKGNKGSLLVMNPRSGEILASVSLPNYDPNRIDVTWERLKKDRESPLLDRTFEGRYPPGSTFKVFTLAVALQLGYVNPTDKFDCPGFFDIGSYRIHEAGGASHGTVTLEDALARSCNIAFAQVGLKIGAHNFCQYARNFGLCEDLNTGIPVKAAPFPEATSLSEGGLAQSAFGQGELVLSPLQLALIISPMAHEGSLMKPYLVKGTSRGGQEPVYLTHPQVWKQPVSRETAHTVTEMMVQVVERGSGRAAGVPGVRVAGKTGTAENPHGADHAWFAGFAPADNPEYLVVVIIENSGFGGKVAAPVAGKVLKECLEMKKEVH
jgi:penicillin-binding protein A